MVDETFGGGAVRLGALADFIAERVAQRVKVLAPCPFTADDVRALRVLHEILAGPAGEQSPEDAAATATRMLASIADRIEALL